MKQKVLIELDALLDTRIAVLATLDQEAATEALNNGWYARPSDDVDLLQKRVTAEAFREAYSKRTADILPSSMVTGIHFLLSDMIQRLEKLHIHAQIKAESVEVEVNVYPYKLTADEMDEINMAVMSRVGVFTPCRCVSIPPSFLTISYINQEEYTGLILYNLQDWCDGALADLGNRPDNAPGVTLMAPGLLKTVKDLPPPEEIKDEKGNQIDPFALVYSLLSEVIGLDFIPVELFCIIPNPGKGKPQNEHSSPDRPPSDIHGPQPL